MTFEEYWFIVAKKTGKTVTKEQLKYYCEIAYGQGQASVVKERPTGEWTPIDEGYPEEETDVLICNVDGDIIVSRGSFSTEIKDKFIWYTSGCG